MNNRKSSIPILLAAAVSLGFVSSCVLRAEPGVPSANTNSTPTAAAPEAPAPATPPPTTAPATAATPTDTSEAPASASSTYTVVAGDSYWLIAKKLHCPVKTLKKINNATTNKLKLGQVLKVPSASAGSKQPSTPAPKATPAPAAKPDASSTPQPQLKAPIHHKVYAQAQPVQDFDIPASTFASCPVPIPSEDDDAPTSSPSTPVAPAETTAPVAQLVSPAEMDADSTPAPQLEKTAPVTSAAAPIITSASATQKPAKIRLSISNPAPTPVANNAPTFVALSSKTSISNSRPSQGSNFFSIFSSKPETDWSTRFRQQAQVLADQGIGYDEDWCPPGESQSLAMDCSNTSRYLYKVTANIQLPRTASDQYYYLHLQNKAWDIPDTASDLTECNYLRQNLKPGDLLFWENTYRPERQPPITHVMVFLGTNEKGQWIMAGSQTSRGGEHNRRHGGPDIYVFNPTQPCGGYSTWLGMVHHHGRFCAYGRPLEADPAKLAVASNE